MNSALYAWGGPGTIRLLKTKYFSPTIDESSFLKLYDPAFLDQAKKIFGTTDMFISYSWGFSDRTEQEDREFIISRLTNFSSRNINTYAYIQGLNLVYSEFSDKDLWCTSPQGTTLPYSRGRKFTCPNNPEAVAIIERRVQAACRQPFTGIFVDNILFGIPPLFIYTDQTSFFGCSCEFCQQEFLQSYGYALPLSRKEGESVIHAYLAFRRQIIKKLLKRLSTHAHRAHKLFGVNLYDPYWRSAAYYFGYDLSDIDPFMDYYLFENHALNQTSIDNSHLNNHLKKNSKPSFVVSYREGIGRESAYSQNDLDLIYSESQQQGYIPCYKATEYTTNGIWHPLRISTYRPVALVHVPAIRHKISVETLEPMPSWLRLFYHFFHMLLIECSLTVPENRLLSNMLLTSPLFSRLLTKRRMVELSPSIV